MTDTATELIEKFRQHSVMTTLTKRDYFAAMAMQGILSNPLLANLKKPHGIGTEELVASDSVLVADALIEELEKK